MFTPLSLLLSAAVAVSAIPTPISERQAQPFAVTLQQPWNAGAVTSWNIHSSCNASERYQLQKGLDEAVELASHAKAHIARWGNNSAVYRKWFGNRPTVEALGSYDIIINGDRADALFRCDDPDGNCVAMPTWGGHYRGSNATMETVICPTSFMARRALSQVCSQGWNVRESNRLIYWASDLIHRLYHVPAFGQGYIDHYADGYEELTGNATLNSVNVTHDSDGLQYFALDAWAHDIILPGEGCPGPVGEIASASSAMSSSTSAAMSSSTSVTPSVTSAIVATTLPATTSSGASSTETALADNCHTHSNGELHCT